MTYEELKIMWIGFEASGEFLAFDRVQPCRSQRPDLHAFMVLSELADRALGAREAAYLARNGDLPDIVSHAEHDQIWLAPDPVALAAVLDEDTVRDLVRCGVLLDAEEDCLFMFA